MRFPGRTISTLVLVAPLAALAGEGAIQITIDGSSLYPDWSPGGDRIAHVANRTPPFGVGHIWTIPARGGSPTQITFAFLEHFDPACSRDGTRIASGARTPQGDCSIYIVPASGGVGLHGLLERALQDLGRPGEWG